MYCSSLVRCCDRLCRRTENYIGVSRSDKQYCRVPRAPLRDQPKHVVLRRVQCSTMEDDLSNPTEQGRGFSVGSHQPYSRTATGSEATIPHGASVMMATRHGQKSVKAKAAPANLGGKQVTKVPEASTSSKPHTSSPATPPLPESFGSRVVESTHETPVYPTPQWKPDFGVTLQRHAHVEYASPEEALLAFEELRWTGIVTSEIYEEWCRWKREKDEHTEQVLRRDMEENYKFKKDRKREDAPIEGVYGDCTTWSTMKRIAANEWDLMCVDCGIRTGNFCDGEDCTAAKRIPSEKWRSKVWRTALCSTCDDNNGGLCHYCRGIPWCRPLVLIEALRQ
jgi:hypothetical protein